MARVIETNLTEEDKRIEGSLRPQYLKDYIGQEKAKSNAEIISKRQSRGRMRWTMYFFTGSGTGKDDACGDHRQ